jgi:hypothetical protein
MFVTKPSMLMSLNLGGQAQASRDLARRARRLADILSERGEKARLIRYAEELEAQADRLEREVGGFHPSVIAPTPANDPSAASD